MLSSPLAVVALPVLAPIVALLQLLFPGLLKDHWRLYRAAIGVLLTQSTLMFIHWALIRWVFTSPQWWLSEQALSAAMLAVAVMGLVVSFCGSSNAASPAFEKPVRLEFIALGLLLAVGLGWASYQYFHGVSPLDQMAIVSLACFVGLMHLWVRKLRASKQPDTTIASEVPKSGFRITTELAFLLTMVLASGLLMAYSAQRQANLTTQVATANWPTWRGNNERTGTARADDPGPNKPIVLWEFTPPEIKGRIILDSSPVAVDGRVLIGATHEVGSVQRGIVYCIADVAGGNVPTAEALAKHKPGSLIWQFTGSSGEASSVSPSGNSVGSPATEAPARLLNRPGSSSGPMRAVYASPTVAKGFVFIGEGYHEDKDCRLFCLDTSTGDEAVWNYATGSHVESSPAIEGDRIIFGAGDDGLVCLEWPPLSKPLTNMNRGDTIGMQREPRLAWKVMKLHIDSSPAVADGKVFVGSLIGDLFQELAALAVDLKSGDVLWKVSSDLPLIASPTFAKHSESGKGYVLFGRANGRVDGEVYKLGDVPRGDVWCLDAATGETAWSFDPGHMVVGSPVVVGDVVYAGSMDGGLHAVSLGDGQPIWRQNLHIPISSSPIVSGGRVFIVTLDGVVHCLDAKTGNSIWIFDELATSTPDAYASPMLLEGRLYVAIAGKVYCLGDGLPQ